MGGAAVLVVKVVGVLPDVEGEDWLEAAGDGVAGAGLLGDDEATVTGGRKPYPAAAEEAGAFGFKVGLEGFEGAPLAFYLGDQILRFAQNDIITSSLELREIQVVIQYLPGIVEYGARGSRADYFLKWQALVRAAGQQLVQVVHVGLQVLAMVEGQCSGADYGLKRIGRVWEVNECKHKNQD